MIFLLFFFSVYFGLNFYFFRKVKKFVNLNSFFVYLFSVMATVSPALYKFYDKVGFDNFYLSFSILLWMGFVFIFFVYHIFIDFYHLLLNFSHKIFGHNPLPHFNSKISFLVIFILSILTTAYGYYETLNLNVYQFRIKSNKVGRDIKILHISDLHLNQVMREEKIKMIIDVYNKVRPDIVISTGDLVDGNVLNKDSYIHLLNQLNPPLGKYAILGNHEYYAGVDQSIMFTQKAGFKLLRDSYVDLPENITIAGVDDDEAVRFGVIRESDDKTLLKNLDKNRFIIFLRHQPKIERELSKYFDVALCGHTHGGVLFPVRYILRKMFISDAGLVKIGDSYVFVSRGVGTGGPPIRIGAPPDIAVFYIKKSP